MMIETKEKFDVITAHLKNSEHKIYHVIEVLKHIEKGLDHISNCPDACDLCREIAKILLAELK